jgi:hypothetical protein
MGPRTARSIRHLTGSRGSHFRTFSEDDFATNTAITRHHQSFALHRIAGRGSLGRCSGNCKNRSPIAGAYMRCLSDQEAYCGLGGLDCPSLAELDFDSGDAFKRSREVSRGPWEEAVSSSVLEATAIDLIVITASASDP